MRKTLLVLSLLLISFLRGNAQCTATATPQTSTNLCPGGDVIIDGNSGGSSYQWMNNGVPIIGATSINYQASVAGNYSVVIDYGTCVATSAPVTVQVGVLVMPINATIINPTTMTTNDGQVIVDGFTPNNFYFVNYNHIDFNNNSVQNISSITADNNGNMHFNNLGVGVLMLSFSQDSICWPNPGIYSLPPTTQIYDSVWPGDVNYDLVADNNDVLDLALAYGQSGTIRTGGSNNWIAQESTDWGTLQTNGMDLKHADCNGDGLVDLDDTLAIYNNYGLTHQKGNHTPMAKVTAYPDLYFDMTGITLAGGTTVSIPIKLGTSGLPMNNFMGLAAQIKVDGITLNTSPVINTTTSWLGNSTNTMNFIKEVSANQTDWAFVRIDHTNVSGDGTIAVMTVDIPAGAAGQNAVFYFDNVKMINNAGDVLTDYNVVDDTATVYPLSTQELSTLFEGVAVVPNPSENIASLQVTAQAISKVQVNITDMLGRSLWSHNEELKPGVNNLFLPSANIAAGVYHVQILNITTGNTQAVKWIRNK